MAIGFPVMVGKFFPSTYRREALKTLKDTGETLAAYINGQVTVALFVGTLSFIGYVIIDLPYALVMALIVAVTNIIPYVGPFLGGAPAVVIALFDSPTKAILVVVVITIAQQLEGNVLISAYFRKKARYTSCNHYYHTPCSRKFSWSTWYDLSCSILCGNKNNHFKFCALFKITEIHC